ncbi:hypothetical protein F4782DRAFT_536673 [Xylaria castorea]|nr:hypothetical protein F4782DRAFT_536673 [Xylaria castorea]
MSDTGPQVSTAFRLINQTNNQNVSTAVLDKCVRDTPTLAAPFTPARSSHDRSAPTSTRKISASFSTDCPLSGHPTIAYSAVTASTTMNHPGPLTSHPINQSSALSSPRPRPHKYTDSFTTDRALKTSYTCSNLPMPAAQSRTCINTRALSGHNQENIPPSLSMADITTTKQSTSEYPIPRLVPKPPSPKKKARLRPGIPKSRTFSVISNLTASLSRTSLGQLTGSDSRRTSTSSKGTARKDKTPYINPKSASSTSSQTLRSPWVETASHRQVYTAQSSAYWAGRFMALQDRFQSETLMPENMKILVHAHAERSLIPVAQPSLASSATMSCITPAAKPMHSTTISTSPRKSQQQQQLPKPKQKSRTDAASSMISHPKTGFVPARPPSCEMPTLLIDEDIRTRRIFMHLDALCATNEARFSLHNWQQCYARRMGKEHLMPDGSTLQKRTRELTWVGRLLVGTGGSHSKKGGFGW